MERGVFERFYNATVKTAIDKICKENKDVKSIDNFEGVYEEYLNQITLLKSVLKDDPSDRLDRHKISACISVAIMKTRLIVDKKINDKNSGGYSLRDSNRMNERLAFYCGMGNLIAFMADDSDDDEEIQKLKEGDFYFPPTNHTAPRLDREKKEIGQCQDYRDSIIRGLYFSNTLSGIQPLMLSNIFFLLEAYYKQNRELERVKNIAKKAGVAIPSARTNTTLSALAVP